MERSTARSCRSQITAALLLVGSIAPFAGLGSETGDCVRFGVPADSRIVVPVYANERGPYGLMLDTGSSLPVIDRRLAERLRLQKLSRRVRLADVNGHESSHQLVVIRHLRIGPIDIPISCVAGEVPVHNVDMIVGMNVLRRRDFAIDFHAKLIRFGPARESGSCTPFDSEAPLSMLPVFPGDPGLTPLADSGAHDVCIYSEKIGARVGPRIRGAHVPITAKSNASRGATGYAKSFQPGPGSWERFRFLTTSNGLRGRPFDGVLSLVALGLEWIHFDFRSGLLCWKRR